MLKTKLRWTALPVWVAITSFAAGCGGDNDNANSSPADGHAANSTAVTQSDDKHDHNKEEESGHGVHGWWCAEHGVPEEECTRCDSSLIAKFKETNDWCEKHDLPDSQCFVCHPENEAKFIARYEAKFGDKPPKRAE